MGNSKQVVVLGAGYAGLAAVRQLEAVARRHVVTLVERNPYHTLETELHLAAAHARRVTIPLEPILERLRTRFYPATVTMVDLDARRVTTSGGELGYDLLLIALGSVTNFFRIPGLAEHALELKTAQDAEKVHQWLLRAHHPQANPESRDVLVGGAGLTGVELATELAVRMAELGREAGVAPGRVHLIEAGPAILPGLDEHARREALEGLRRRGVVLHTSTRVVSAAAGVLHLEDGANLRGGLIVWTGGVRAPDPVAGERLGRGQAGRLVVTRKLEVAGYPGVFAAGDLALARDRDERPVPPSGQAAGHQGRVAGKNVRRLLEERPLEEYVPSTLGELISLGGLVGAGWVRLPWSAKLRLTGHAAGLAKRASEWRHLQEVRGPRL